MSRVPWIIGIFTYSYIYKNLSGVAQAKTLSAAVGGQIL